jgi:hypothetical protein
VYFLLGQDQAYVYFSDNKLKLLLLSYLTGAFIF